MKQDGETKERLLQCAKEEFLEKGYMKASLRNICRNAGVTTGALYFFFEDKADLFEVLTKDTVESIYRMMQEHYAEENMALQKGAVNLRESIERGEDWDAARAIIHQMYLDRERLLLVLTKAQGTKYEHIADLFIEASEKHYRQLARAMQITCPEVSVDEGFIHWMAHEQIDAFIHMITHMENEEEAVGFIGHVVTYMISGWFGLFREK